MALEQRQTLAVPGPAANAGTGLFATTTIRTAQDVCNLPAFFATVLDTARLADTCSNCFGTRSTTAQLPGSAAEHGLKLCTGCRTMKYCDKACQAENWKAAHKYECSIYSGLRPNILPVMSRAVLRIVLLKAAKKIAHRDLKIFEKELQSHIKDIEQTNKERFERILLSAKAVHSYSKTEVDLNTIVDYFGKLEINGFNLTTPFYDRIGVCTHPFASFINHSCDPNAVVGFDGGRLFVKALRDINEGDQIFISYIDNTDPFELRQKELRERYFFDCACTKCANGNNAREDRFLITAPSHSGLMEAERKAVDFLKSAKLEESPSSAVEKLHSAMDILRQTEAWATTRQPLVQLRDELIAYLLEGQQFWPAFIQSAIRYLRVDPVVFPGLWHPLRNVHAWTFVKLAIYLFQPPDVTTPETTELQRYGINLGLVIYSVLDDLNKLSNELPTAQKTYKENYAEVRQTFEANGLNPEDMENEIWAEWAKIEKLVDDALKGEVVADYHT